MNIFILIPAFNERGNLTKLIEGIEKQSKKLGIRFKIFFVLQGNDGSRELLEKLKRQKKFIDFVYFPKPLGIGYAYKIGYSHIDKSADLVLTMDADLNHDIKDLSGFIKQLEKDNCDLIIGSRFINGGKFDETRIWKKIASLLTNKIVSTLLGLKIKDVTSGFRLIKIDVVKKVSKKLHCSGYPSYMEFILSANKLGFKIKEIPITYHHRIWGKSKISSISTIIDYIRFLGSLLLNF